MHDGVVTQWVGHDCVTTLGKLFTPIPAIAGDVSSLHDFFLEIPLYLAMYLGVILKVNCLHVHANLNRKSKGKGVPCPIPFLDREPVGG